jgi:dTDP-4-dehydrorhamnose 3,5-epimerase
MIFRETELRGAFIIEIEPIEDERGFFARTFCRDEFRARGLDAELRQCSLSFNRRRGTLRGLHYQAEPHAEVKQVRCTRGRVYDVIVDLRRGSPTRGRWIGVELGAEDRRALHVPAGFAHGFQTLEDASELFYQMSEPYWPELARGLRWDDPSLAIAWPFGDPIVSDRDRALPTLAELEREGAG